MKLSRSIGTFRLPYAHVLSITLILLLFFTGISESSERSKGKTLKEIKDELLGKEVVLLGSKVYETLSGWNFVRENQRGGFEMASVGIPYKMKGTRGDVVFIGQSAALERMGRKSVGVDAFGDKIKEEDIVDPYIDVVVRLADGRLIMQTTFYISLMTCLEIASRFDEKKGEILKTVDSLLGRTIYPVGYSCLFPPDSEIEWMAGQVSCTGRRNRMDIPNLTPLRIVRTKYLEGQHAILLKVEFLNGRTALILGEHLEHLHSPFTAETLLKETTLGFVRDIDKLREEEGLTEGDIRAIREGVILRGMSESALHYSVGFESKENDWGHGGKQLIYGDRIYVYVQNGKVTEWQIMSK